MTKKVGRPKNPVPTVRLEVRVPPEVAEYLGRRPSKRFLEIVKDHRKVQEFLNTPLK